MRELRLTAEQALLSAVLSDPAGQVMRDLRAAGKPADPVTTCWETARRGITATPADLTDGNGALAVASARDVHRHGLLAHATQTGYHLQEAAADPGCPPRTLLRSAAERLARLDRDAGPASELLGRFDAGPVGQPASGRDARVITLPRPQAITRDDPAQSTTQAREASP